MPAPLCHARRGSLLAIGGAERRHRRGGILKTFVDLAGGGRARILLSTTATELPDAALASYLSLLGELGAASVRELRIVRPADADDERNLRALRQATGVLFSGGDQSRFGVLVRSRAHELLRARLHQDALVVAGTSAGATALGSTMVLGPGGPGPSRPRTGPGLGLVPDTIIDMHFTERRRLSRLVGAVCAHPGALGIGIDEDTAILLRDRHFEVLGAGAVTVVDAEPASVVPPAEPDGPTTVLDMHLHVLGAGCAFDLELRRPAAPSCHGERRHDAH
jgi:cyanophycinase